MPELRKITTEQYKKNYDYLVREAGSKDYNDLLKYIMSKQTKLATTLNYLNTIVSLAKNDPDLFTGDIKNLTEKRNDLSDERRKALSEDNLTKRQRDILEKVTLNDVNGMLEKLKEVKDNSTKDLEDYLMLALMLPLPLRNDLQDIKIVDKRTDLKKLNGIWIPKIKNKLAVLRITEHKASDRPGNGPIERELDADLTADVKEFVRRNSVLGKREYLFADKDGNPYSSSAFCHKFQRLFKRHLGVPFSSSTLRKLYWSAENKEIIDDLKQKARGMGHSLQTAMRHYVAK